MSNPELQKLFEFDEGDLAMNRAGRLSKKQQQRLKENEATADRFFTRLGIFLILLGLFISYQMLRGMFPDGVTLEGIMAQSTQQMTEMAFALGFPWLILGAFIYFSFWMASTKLDHSIDRVHGIVNFVKVQKQESYKTASGSTSQRTVQQYELRVGKHKFHDVPEEYLNVLEEGHTYVFHFVKSTKEILSAELLSTGKQP